MVKTRSLKHKGRPDREVEKLQSSREQADAASLVSSTHILNSFLDRACIAPQAACGLGPVGPVKGKYSMGSAQADAAETRRTYFGQTSAPDSCKLRL